MWHTCAVWNVGQAPGSISHAWRIQTLNTSLEPVTIATSVSHSVPIYSTHNVCDGLVDKWCIWTFNSCKKCIEYKYNNHKNVRQIVDDFESLDDNSSHIPISLNQRSNYTRVSTMNNKMKTESISGMASENESIKEIKVYKMKPEEMQHMKFEDYQDTGE